MSWIETAKKQGKDQAEAEKQAKRLAEEDKALYNAEKVSEDLIEEYLEPFLTPVQEVLYDLLRAGFTIEADDLKYICLGEVESEMDATKLRRTYSMARVQSISEGHRTDRYNAAIGLRFTIRHPQNPSRPCALQVFPKAVAWTHFAGVEYRVGRQIYEVLTPQSEKDVLQFLQTSLGNWLMEMEKTRELRSE